MNDPIAPEIATTRDGSGPQRERSAARHRPECRRAAPSPKRARHALRDQEPGGDNVAIPAVDDNIGPLRGNVALDGLHIGWSPCPGDGPRQPVGQSPQIVAVLNSLDPFARQTRLAKLGTDD